MSLIEIMLAITVIALLFFCWSCQRETDRARENVSYLLANPEGTARDAEMIAELEADIAAKDLVLSGVEVRLHKAEAMRDEAIEKHWQLAVKYDALADKYGTALQTIRERKG
jgi:hypothetical protein